MARTPAIYRLKNPVQNYSWGSATAIPRLLNTANPSGAPVAELWLGAHPKAPSVVVMQEGERSLLELIEEDPDTILGAGTVERFGPSLPFLLKVLASEKALALQVHPNRDQAEEGFERENARGIRLDAPERNYLDTNHKPEMLCALEPFWCLAGFRNAAEIAGELSSLRLTATARQIGAFTRSPTIDGLKRLFDSIMLMADGSKEMFVREVVGKAAAAAGDRFKWILELNRQYPGDIGVVSPLFLNLLRLRAGQAVYIAPGMVHAYLRGFGIELMSNSDNVVRGGLSVRHVNIPEFVRILQYDDCPVEPIDPTEVRTGIDLYEIPASDFRLIRIRLNRGFGYISHRNRAVEILICVAGAAILRHPGAEKDVPIGKGDSLLIPADVPEYQIEGQGMLYMAAV